MCSYLLLSSRPVNRGGLAGPCLHSLPRAPPSQDDGEPPARSRPVWPLLGDHKSQET
jgi:hypothetical protein